MGLPPSRNCATDYFQQKAEAYAAAIFMNLDLVADTIIQLHMQEPCLANHDGCTSLAGSDTSVNNGLVMHEEAHSNMSVINTVHL